MTDNVTRLSKGTYGTEFHGPFSGSMKISVDGIIVPHIRAKIVHEDLAALCLDDRYELIVPKEDAEKWLPFLANCMAVSAGYASHGSDEKLNQFNRRIFNLGEGLYFDSK